MFEEIPFATMNIQANITLCSIAEQKKTGHIRSGFINGGARRDRTVDLYAASVALSQLSYGPVILAKASSPIPKAANFAIVG